MKRPRKPTQKIQELLHAISLGATYKMACSYAGIGESTFHKELAMGREGQDAESIEFLASIKKAEAEAGLKWLGQIEAAAQQGNWQAAAWRLERRYPQEYARRQISIVQGVNFDSDGSLDESIKEAIAIVAMAIKGSKNKEQVSKYLLSQIAEEVPEESEPPMQ